MDHRFGLGVMTTTAGILVPGGGAITGWIGLTPGLGIQPLIDISTTSPTMQMAAGALIKYTVVQLSTGGFHIGAGLTLGSATSKNPADNGGNALTVGIAGVFGAHFLVPGTTNILVSADGGPQININGGHADFILEPLSLGLGLSLIYMF